MVFTDIITNLRNNSITDLELTNEIISQERMHVLCNSLRTNQSLRQLKLFTQVFNSEQDFTNLILSLRGHSNLQQLKVLNNVNESPYISDETINRILNFLARNNSLTEVNLNQNRIHLISNARNIGQNSREVLSRQTNGYNKIDDALKNVAIPFNKVEQEEKEIKKLHNDARGSSDTTEFTEQVVRKAVDNLLEPKDQSLIAAAILPPIKPAANLLKSKKDDLCYYLAKNLYYGCTFEQRNIPGVIDEESRFKALMWNVATFWQKHLYFKPSLKVDIEKNELVANAKEICIATIKQISPT